MNPPLLSPAARAAPGRRHRRRGFTLVEVMLGAGLTAVLLVAALSGVVALQKSYSATESYGTGLADQMRLLDYLAQDLRRAANSTAGTNPWAMDADKQGLKISMPDYYRFNASDPQHLFPVANDPIYDASSGVAYYSSAVSSGQTAATSAAAAPRQTIAYRYTNGVTTRTDPWAPLVADGKGGYVGAGPIPIATTLQAFPDLTPTTDGTTLGYHVSFYSTFQPLAVPGSVNSSSITLHNVTFVRSKNLSR